MTARGTQALKRNVSKKWLTPADVLCVLDDLYTYDAILADAELRHETPCPITRPVWPSLGEARLAARARSLLRPSRLVEALWGLNRASASAAYRGAR